MCFHARALSGEPRQDNTETKVAKWLEVDQVPALSIHPSMRRRIDDALANRSAPTIV